MTESPRQTPFVGLRPYESSDSLFYFGRNEQTKSLLHLLHLHRFITVVGSSGAGKSSLIQAGLIPQLEAGFLVQSRDKWAVVYTKPGDSPVRNLISNLLQALSKNDPGKNLDLDISQLIESISKNGVQTLTQHLKQLLTNTDTNLFILVDQFEELFSIVLDKEKSRSRQEAEQYIALLLSLNRHDLPIYICLAIRSDFLGDCEAFYGLTKAINKSQFLVPRLTPSQQREVITHPANLVGAKVSQNLVDKLVNENNNIHDNLPILQYTLMRTWDDWQAKGAIGNLDLQHYENIHTIHEALDRHADEALEELTTEKQKHIAKILFQALTSVDTVYRRIKKPVYLNEVCAISESSPKEVMQVIECFCSKNRLFLELSSKEITDNPQINLSHESLINQWKTLGRWVKEGNERNKAYESLLSTLQRFQESSADSPKKIDLEHIQSLQAQTPQLEPAKIQANRYDEHFTKIDEFLKLTEADSSPKKEDQRHLSTLLTWLSQKAELEKQLLSTIQKSAEKNKPPTKTRWQPNILAEHKYLPTLTKPGLLFESAKKFAYGYANGDESLNHLPYLGQIAAGKPLEALSDSRQINLGRFFGGAGRYVLRISGDSMVDAGIFDEDYVVIRKQKTALPGSIVVALVDQREATLKYYHPHSTGVIELRPGNEILESIYYAADSVVIQGVLIGVFRDYELDITSIQD